jgi:hypothetical protein
MKTFRQFIKEEFPVQDLTQQSGLTSRGEMSGVKGLVIHHSGGRGDAGGLINTAHARSRQGQPYWAQYGMNRDGSVFQYGPGKTNHVKNSFGKDVPVGLGNHNMHGIEIIAKDDNDITPEQHAAIKHFAAWHQGKHGYDAKTGLYGHSELNPGHRHNEGAGIANDLRSNFDTHSKNYKAKYIDKSSTETPTQPEQKPEPQLKEPPKLVKTGQVSPTPMATRDMSLTPTAPKTQPQVKQQDPDEKSVAAKPEEPKVEPAKAETSKAEPQSSAGKSWSQVRADAGFSARQSVTSDPKLLDLYNKYKEGNLNENFEQFVKKKYKKKDEHLDEDLQKIKNSAKLAAAEFHKNMVDYYGHPYDITGTPTEIASAVAAGTLGPTAHKLAKKAKPIAKKVAIKVLRKMRNK